MIGDIWTSGTVLLAALLVVISIEGVSWVSHIAKKQKKENEPLTKWRRNYYDDKE